MPTNPPSAGRQLIESQILLLCQPSLFEALSFRAFARLFEIIRSSHSYGYEPACPDGRKKNEHRLDYQVENPNIFVGAITRLPAARFSTISPILKRLHMLNFSQSKDFGQKNYSFIVRSRKLKFIASID